MGILSLSGVALLAAMSILLLRELRPSFAAPVRLAASVILLDVILRALGIALVCELTASFCRDLGESTLAEGVQLFGKLEILVLSLPLLDKVMEMAKELLRY